MTVVQVLWNASAGADPLLWPSPAVPFLPCPISGQPQTPEPDPGEKSVTGSKPSGSRRRRLTADGSGNRSDSGSGSESPQHGAHTRSRGNSGGSELASGSVVSGYDLRSREARGHRRLSEAEATATERLCDPSRTKPFLNKPRGSHLMSFQDYDNGDGGVAVCMAPLHGGDLQVSQRRQTDAASFVPLKGQFWPVK